MLGLKCTFIKKMPLNSELRWSAYNEVLELSGTKKVDPRLHFDLNWCACPFDTRSHV